MKSDLKKIVHRVRRLEAELDKLIELLIEVCEKESVDPKEVK